MSFQTKYPKASTNVETEISKCKSSLRKVCVEERETRNDQQHQLNFQEGRESIHSNGDTVCTQHIYMASDVSASPLTQTQKELLEVRALGLTKTKNTIRQSKGIDHPSCPRESSAKKELETIRALGLTRILSSKLICTNKEQESSKTLIETSAGKELGMIRSLGLTKALISKSMNTVKDKKSIDTHENEMMDEFDDICLSESLSEDNRSIQCYYEIEFDETTAAVSQVVRKYASDYDAETIIIKLDSCGEETGIEENRETANSVAPNPGKVKGMKRFLFKKKKKKHNSYVPHDCLTE